MSMSYSAMVNLFLETPTSSTPVRYRSLRKWR